MTATSATDVPDADELEASLSEERLLRAGLVDAAMRFAVHGDDPESGHADKGATALFFAAHRGHDRCVELLLPHSDPKASRSDGQTALMAAAALGREKTVGRKRCCPRSRLEKAGPNLLWSLVFHAAESTSSFRAIPPLRHPWIDARPLRLARQRTASEDAKTQQVSQGGSS